MHIKRKNTKDQQLPRSFSAKRAQESKKRRKKIITYSLLTLTIVGVSGSLVNMLMSKADIAPRQHVSHKKIEDFDKDNKTALALLDGTYNKKKEEADAEKAKKKAEAEAAAKEAEQRRIKEQQEAEAKATEQVIKQQVDEATRSVTEKAKSQIDSAKRQVDSAQKQVDSLTKANKDLQTSNEKLQGDKDSLQATNDKLQKELNDLKAKLSPDKRDDKVVLPK